MERLRFLDHFLSIFGIQGLDDYQTKICSSQFKKPDQILQQINDSMPQIKKLFKTSSLQLSRIKYQIDSIPLAISLLKNLLKQCQINFYIQKSNGTNLLRLSPPNNLLREYIMNKKEYIDPKPAVLSEAEPIESGYPETVIWSDFMKTLSVTTIDYDYFKIYKKDLDLRQSFAPLYPMTKYELTAGSSPLFQFENVSYVFRINEDGQFITESSIPLNGDTISNFDINLIDDGIVDNTSVINKCQLLCGNIIINDCNRICLDNPFPRLLTTYQEIRLLVFWNDFRDAFTKKKDIKYNYLCTYLQNDIRKKLVKSTIKYNDSLIKNGMIESDRLYWNLKGNQTINYGTSSMQFRVPRYWDGIYDLQCTVKDLDGNKFNNLLASVNIEIGGEIIDVKVNTTLETITWPELTPVNFIPLSALYYHEIILKFKTYQPLLDDQYISIQFKNASLTNDQRTLLQKNEFYFMSTNLVSGGMRNLVSPNQIELRKIPSLEQLLQS